MRVIPFGELFNIYNYISDKCVGICLRARKHKYIEFEGEMLFQRRDDDVPIFLLRPIQDIRHEINNKVDEIKRGCSPAPQATTLMMDKANCKTKSRSCSGTPAQTPPASKPVSKATSPGPDLPHKPKIESPATTKVIESVIKELKNSQLEEKSENTLTNQLNDKSINLNSLPSIVVDEAEPLTENN